MAVGIGEMCSISCPENFNYPYMIASVSEFWRRWHITLGAWFRDYIYIPMGGSRVDSKVRLYWNLFVVWLLTGIWHGANWTFIFFGMLYFAAIAIEKTLDIPKRFHTQAGRIAYRLLTLLFINFQWVIFRAPNLYTGLHYIKHMFLAAEGALTNHRTVVLLREYGVFIFAAILFATPVIPMLHSRLTKDETGKRVGSIGMATVLCLLFI